MHDRSLLGPADVDDAELRRMVAELLGHEPREIELLDSVAETFPYDLPAITTAGRYWVTGTARTPRGTERFRMFVKHVQSWSRSPLFAFVPEEIREWAEAAVPWRTEPLVYRSDLGERLPGGLRMPRALGVLDLDELSAAVWLEDVSAPAVPWDFPRFARAAHLLGRLAASHRVAELARVGCHDWTVHHYVTGRLEHQVLPALMSDDLWRHPLVAAGFGPDLRDRIRAAAARAGEYGEELGALPLLTAHGDSSPNNLLPDVATDSFVLVDYGFWNSAPVGFDLSQLIVGDVQIGHRSAALLAETEAVCVPAYTEGLRAEGSDLDEHTVLRGHALKLLLFTGLSSVPLEHLDADPTPGLVALVEDRARIALHSLDLVEATGGQVSSRPG